MDSENDKKRLDVELDRLSSLPDDLIHKILSFNDTIDAIKTSTLSSRWRFIWTTMMCLAFSSEDFPNLRKFSKFVTRVLSGRDNQREVSSVKLTFRGKPVYPWCKGAIEKKLTMCFTTITAYHHCTCPVLVTPLELLFIRFMGLLYFLSYFIPVTFHTGFKMGSEMLVTWGYFKSSFIQASIFREVLVITGSNNFETNYASYVHDLPETNYASYLVYKLPRDQSTFEAPMFVWEKYGFRNNGWYIYLVSPPHTPVIGPNFDENSYSPQNKPKLNAVPRQRTDGWMEVKVWGFTVWGLTKSVFVHLQFEHPSAKDLYGLIIQGIDIRPI
ncbi:F-box domain, Leucine-rich repeat domain, L domain-like protein [Artemisia annua]|uniref:F-box domain, Leucine-rich repeat domain, L domain-like protein n=1 Tax=Artemisia annua TaxID=35608 RepID=A0A2U1LK88_ARTAN|nr:F-box domain, Leucine-rich repeat domain, L domain-like protein [Artemisia annua]